MPEEKEILPCDGHNWKRGNVRRFSIQILIIFSLLFGGTTVHSAFCIPANANLSPTYMPQIGPLTLRFAKLKLAQIIIIDEVTMMHKALLNVLDRTLRWIKKNDKPFGGVVLVLGGDWKQLLPVVKAPFDTTLYAQIEACLQSDQVYALFEHIVLTENMRAKADPKFVDFIERVQFFTLISQNHSSAFFSLEGVKK